MRDMDKLKFLAAFSALIWGSGYGTVSAYAGSGGVMAEAVKPEFYEIKGRVVDELHEPLPGAVIKVKGTTTGALTDIDGNFRLNVPDSKKVTITVSFVGLKTVELVAVPEKAVYVEMVSEENMLEELIVSGFQTIRSEERRVGKECRL